MLQIFFGKHGHWTMDMAFNYTGVSKTEVGTCTAVCQWLVAKLLMHCIAQLQMSNKWSNCRVAQKPLKNSAIMAPSATTKN